MYTFPPLIAEAIPDTELEMILELSFENLKTKIPEERKINLQKINVVSLDESSNWLIDYWCKKDVRGLLQMPFSRHWIMHVEACLKIQEKLHLKK